MTQRENPTLNLCIPYISAPANYFPRRYLCITPSTPPSLPRPPVGFWALITTRTRCPVQPPEAGREEIMAPAERSLVPPTGRRLIPHHQPIHPWPPLPASFAKYSFCCVQVVAGGGGGVVRSRYSQKGWSVEWRGGCVWGGGVGVGMGVGGTIREHMHSKAWKSLESQITFAKVMRQNKSCLISSCSDVFLMYLTMAGPHCLGLFSLAETWVWSDVGEAASKATLVERNSLLGY